MAALYLSPHYDDVCFSLGMTARESGGLLVNVYTLSNYMDGELGPTAEITKIREAEDSAFAAACGLQRHNFGFSEATVQDLGPFDLTRIEEDVDALEEPLIDFLLARGGADIYCPLAVGRHRNHISVFLAVVKAYAALRPASKIYFYEDLPYAAQPVLRSEALQRLAYYFPGKALSRHAHQLDDSEMKQKMALVEMYKSQHPEPATAQKFTPAEPATPFPHEAFWEVAA